MAESVLHRLNSTAFEGGLLLLACQQYPVVSRPQAEARCRSFDLEELLDVWHPHWRDVAPTGGMGVMTQRLHALTYAVFVGVWEEKVGFLLHHPKALGPKSVTLNVTAKEQGAPRAHLCVTKEQDRALIAFPKIPQALLEPKRSLPFAAAAEALETLVSAMVERVNLVSTAVLLTHR